MRTVWIARGPLLAMLAIGMLAALLAPAVPPAQAVSTEISDALLVVKANQTPSNSQLSVLLSQATPLPSTDTVVIGRSDVFADSLASGVLQGESPLLLVPPQGPIPAEVTAELTRLAPQRVILLGGTTAIGAVVEQELAGSYAVERRAGTTRIETAIEIARRDAPQATTAMLARAFPSAGGDATQAFADTLAAGGLAAENHWPVLLTATDSLPQSTRAYLASSPITDVTILGGTSAISQAIEDELRTMGLGTERVQGASRFSTAVAVAGKRGASDARDVERVTLVEGQGPDAWAGGFTAAAHSALFDAPILLTSGAELPADTNTFLAANTLGTGRFAVETVDLSAPVLTCVTPVQACERGRVALGLPPSATVRFEPTDSTTLTAGQDVTVTVGEAAGGGFAQAEQITIGGTCLDADTTVPAGPGSTTVTVSATLPQPCTIDVAVPLENGSTQMSTATYPGGRIVGQVGSATTSQPIAGATVTLSTGAMTATDTAGGFTFVDLPGGSYTATVTADGFQDNTSTRVDVEPAVDAPVSVLLSPQLQAGEVRIVLSWDDDPADLDSHLWTPQIQPYHLFYARQGTAAACPFAALDIDDISGFGPETMTVSQAIPGSYRYAVHRFSGNQTLSQSTAVVQVFDPSGLIGEFAVPQNGTAEHVWWHVFDIDVGAGVLTPINRLQTVESAVAPYALPDSC